MPDRLTAQHTLGEWLRHPQGGPLLRAVFEALGAGASPLGSAAGIPLGALVELSRGLVTDEVVERLVREVNGGEIPEDSDDQIAAVRRPVESGLTLADIHIRDPFILDGRDSGEYWLYGSTDPNIWFGPGIGFDAYRSTDLDRWEGPYPAFRPPEGFWSPGQYWAPEVHRRDGRCFMFATFTGVDGHRGTQILVSDGPPGPFVPWSDGPVTPADQQCLDGTLHVDDEGAAWIVYCHEWTQIGDGAVVAQRLAPDLTRAFGDPVVLFHASEAEWVRPVPSRPGDESAPCFVTDGPFLIRMSSGGLALIWSSFGDDGYAVGIAHSSDGTLTGTWRQDPRPIRSADGGHGMVFPLADGTLALVVHQPNTTPDERAVIIPLVESGGRLRVRQPV